MMAVVRMDEALDVNETEAMAVATKKAMFAVSARSKTDLLAHLMKKGSSRVG